MTRIRSASLIIAMLAAGTLLLVSGCGGKAAQTPAAGGSAISIENVWARPVSDGAHGATSAVYMVLENSGKTDDVMIKAVTSVSKMVELHETKMDDTVMKMVHVGRFELPAGQKVELKPGGKHIMLMGMQKGLAVGDTFTLTVTFEKAGDVELTVTVREP